MSKTSRLKIKNIQKVLYLTLTMYFCISSLGQSLFSPKYLNILLFNTKILLFTQILSTMNVTSTYICLVYATTKVALFQKEDKIQVLSYFSFSHCLPFLKFKYYIVFSFLTVFSFFYVIYRFTKNIKNIERSKL